MKLPRMNASDRTPSALELGLHRVTRGGRSTIVPAGQGVCYSILNEDGECIVSGDNCVEGSATPVKSTYMGMTVCGCRCD